MFLREALREEATEGLNYVLTGVRGGSSLQLGGDLQSLNFTLTPTPRWPDLFVAYHPPSMTLFTGKLFRSRASNPLV
jgi:flavorubredoxin